MGRSILSLHYILLVISKVIILVRNHLLSKCMALTQSSKVNPLWDVGQELMIEGLNPKGVTTLTQYKKMSCDNKNVM